MSEIKVNKISPRSGTTVTLGDSGDTFTIPAGATINNQGTATNFGATGSASWTTTVKTSGFTAVAGEGYFVNTTGGAISVNLPAGTAGAVVAFKDYLGTFDNNALTLVPNGSDKIGGDNTTDAKLEQSGIAVTLVFIDSTQGWLVTDSGLQSEAPTTAFVAATGGTITTSGNFKIHTFTGPGTFCVSCAGNAGGSNTVDYLAVAGGGGGGAGYGGGGGAGGYRFSNGTASGCYTAGPSPLGASALPVTATSFPITVGAGGAASTGSGSPGSMTAGGNGANSVFSTVTSTGGGGGGAHMFSQGQRDGKTGGSGGGGGNQDPGAGPGAGGTGNTPPVSPPQGNTGGNGYHDAATFAGGGGGGGASAVGGSIPSSPPFGPPTIGTGGAGLTSCITASPVARGGGGGGGAHPSRNPAGAGGTGGGGAGGDGAPCGAGTPGTVNTGGGAGGGGANGPTGNGGVGGSGIVIIRYKFQ